MVFKTDKQRRAVMAKLNQGQTRSDVSPKLITLQKKFPNRIIFKVQKFDKNLFTKGKSKALFVVGDRKAFEEAQKFPNIKTTITPIFPK